MRLWSFGKGLIPISTPPRKVESIELRDSGRFVFRSNDGKRDKASDKMFIGRITYDSNHTPEYLTERTLKRAGKSFTFSPKEKIGRLTSSREKA